MSSMSDKLKKLIKDHPDWTQQRLAKELGTSQFNVHQLIYKNNIEYRDKTILFSVLVGILVVVVANFGH